MRQTSFSILLYFKLFFVSHPKPFLLPYVILQFVNKLSVWQAHLHLLLHLLQLLKDASEVGEAVLGTDPLVVLVSSSQDL